MSMIVELRNVEKWYDEGTTRRQVLHGVDMHIQAGERVALVGKSGSGKSSLLNIISGIDYANAGDVIIGGSDINQLSEAARTQFRRKHVGFVFQFFNLVPTLTVLENVLLPDNLLKVEIEDSLALCVLHTTFFLQLKSLRGIRSWHPVNLCKHFFASVAR